MKTKQWFESKTLWVNIIAIIVFLLQGLQAHFFFSPEFQAIILAVINFLVRFTTDTKVTL